MPTPIKPTPRAEVASRSRMKSLWQRWTNTWSVLFYGLLVAGLAIALSRPDVNALVPMVGVTVGYAGWYEYFGNRRKIWARGRRWEILYFAVAASLWLTLVVLDPAFVFAGVGLFAHVCVTDRAWGVVAAIIFGSGFVVAELAAPRPFNSGVFLTAVFVATIFWFLSRLFQDLNDYAEEQRGLVRDLQAAREDIAIAEREAGQAAERQRLAREIHDTMAQGFTSVVMLLEAADAALPEDPERARSHIEMARDTSRQNLSAARSVVGALRSPQLSHATLSEALEGIAAESARRSGVDTDFELVGTPAERGTDVEESLLRATQESLANVTKHAGATRAKVTLSYEDEGVRLDVRDDGVGFAAPQAPPPEGGHGLGLVGMRERVEALGGMLTVESTPGSGTTISVFIPAVRAGPMGLSAT